MFPADDVPAHEFPGYLHKSLTIVLITLSNGCLMTPQLTRVGLGALQEQHLSQRGSGMRQMYSEDTLSEGRR